MQVTPTAIPDVKLIEPKVFGDARGFLAVPGLLDLQTKCLSNNTAEVDVVGRYATSFPLFEDLTDTEFGNSSYTVDTDELVNPDTVGPAFVTGRSEHVQLIAGVGENTATGQSVVRLDLFIANGYRANGDECFFAVAGTVQTT